MRIEFCAPMGIGKTTMAAALAKYYNYELVEEASINHPFLPDFYKDPQKYGFEKDAYFALAYNFNVKKLAGQNTIFDAGHLGNQAYNALTPKKPEEKAVMDALYAQAETLPPPDLIIYLDYAPEKIIERIIGRGREMEKDEKDMLKDYIPQLQQAMVERLPSANAPVLRLNMEDFDLINRPDDVLKIARLVSERLKKPAPAKRPTP